MKISTDKKARVRTKSLFRFEKKINRQEQDTTTADPTTYTVTLTSTCCPTGV